MLRRLIRHVLHPKAGEILMLHRVVEQRSSDANRELEVTPTFLRAAIGDYRRRGFRFVGIDEAADPQQWTRSPFVCLTFDDGYLDTLTLAAPLLRELQVPFAVYVTTGFTDGTATPHWYHGGASTLSWAQIAALDAEPLCTIGAHTLTHPRLTTLAADDARREILQSKARLESMLGHSVDHFSYPHGDHNAAVAATVRSAGFRSALCAWGGSLRRHTPVDPFLLPRIQLRQP